LSAAWAESHEDRIVDSLTHPSTSISQTALHGTPWHANV
jgi:hypothetical protein